MKKNCKHCKGEIKPKEDQDVDKEDFCSKCKWVICPQCEVSYIIRDKYPTCYNCKTKTGLKK